MKTDQFRELGHALIEWIAAYREGVARLPVKSPLEPGAVRARLPAAPPEQGGGLAGLLGTLEDVVLPGITHWNHPRFFAYFPSNTSLASVLADLVSAGLGPQAMSWQTSPAATEIEEVTLDWLRQLLGLSSAFTGVIHDTASTATLCALLCARERASGFAQEGEGLQGGGAPLTVYASAEAHSSIGKAVALAGLGRAQLRSIPTDAAHALRPELLERALADDRAAGRRPCAVIATIGTTGSTAIDPLARIAELAARHGAWLHVDAALAGSAMILPECRPLWRGIEAADSLVLNPHKWLGTGFDLSTYYVRDPALLVRVMSTDLSILRTAEDGSVRNYRDWQIPLGRRFRALKLWFLLLDQGVVGLQARLRRDLAAAQFLAAQVDAAPDWERLAPVPLQTVCLRHRPAGMSEESELARHNLGIAERINRSGFAYLTPTRLRGLQALRVSLGAEPTERADVEALWSRLCAEAVA